MTDRVHFVLIRGLLRDARHWGDFTDALQQRFPHSLISTPDVPGNGRLCHAVSPTTIAAMTDALRGQIMASYPLTLIGLSMGGMIAIDWMCRYPNEVEAAVLINTSVKPLSPFYQRLHWMAYPRLLRVIVHTPAEREADILNLTSNYHQHDGQLLRNWQSWQRQCPVSTVSAKNQFLAAVKFSLPVNKPRQSILVVTSTADRLVDYHCSLKLSQAWQTDYLQHDTAGHDLPLDEPEWLACVIARWFNHHCLANLAITCN